MERLELSRPLVFFDLETTGLDITLDRIVEIAMIRLNPDGTREEWVARVNPGRPISPEATAVHGICDEDVAYEPKFEALAPKVQELLKDADLAGYNSTRFDIPMLAEELLRAGYFFSLDEHRCVDVFNIFTKKEGRTLADAVRFYCDRELENAHSALADIRATIDVLQGQLKRYPDLQPEVSWLAEYSTQRRTADIAGRLHYDGQGRVIFSFGKYKGQPVAEVFRRDPGYYSWILGADFPEYTKRVLTEIREALKA